MYILLIVCISIFTSIAQPCQSSSLKNTRVSHSLNRPRSDIIRRCNFPAQLAKRADEAATAAAVAVRARSSDTSTTTATNRNRQTKATQLEAIYPTNHCERHPLPKTPTEVQSIVTSRRHPQLWRRQAHATNYQKGRDLVDLVWIPLHVYSCMCVSLEHTHSSSKAISHASSKAAHTC
jgi:hypothetical protein